MRKIRIAPSLISADFARLGEEIALVEKGGADLLHWDVMDGHFVPNITLGWGIIKNCRNLTKLPFIAHLMVENPDKYADKFLDAGCQYVTVHAEATNHLHRTVCHIRELGGMAGVALNPSTPLSTLEFVAEEIDLILIMSVNPGFSGQKFIRGVVPKVAQARKLIDERHLACELEVDGGVNAETVPLVAGAGATIIVAASAIFDGKNRVAENIANLRKAAETT